MVTGIDLVREQLLIADGGPLSFRQEDVRLSGHSIQCRINAEDPLRGFVPTPGRITRYREPAGPGVRVDSGAAEGAVISELYDPMIAKLIVWDSDRDRARRRMLRALGEFEIEGVSSLIGLHTAIMEHPEFAAGGTLREFVEGGGYARSVSATQASGGGGAAQPVVRELVAEVDGKRFRVSLVEPEPPGRARLRERRALIAERSHRGGGGGEVVRSPMQGNVLRVAVSEGDQVEAGQVLLVVEAMKMENEIVSHRAGIVEGISATEGAQVTSGQELLRVI
jgi:acetyl-CoA/propionyl-CoA/long-chain acyl-CoA carboxylase, biotin carboxylase, biotin carboxyl carrier protein